MEILAIGVAAVAAAAGLVVWIIRGWRSASEQVAKEEARRQRAEEAADAVLRGRKARRRYERMSRSERSKFLRAQAKRQRDR